MANIPNNLRNSLDSFLKEIEPICSLDKVILYGSLVKGTINKESDIDLAIFSKSVNNNNRIATMAKILAKVPKYKLDFQPLVFSFQDFTSAENTFIQEEIKNKGIALR